MPFRSSSSPPVAELSTARALREDIVYWARSRQIDDLVTIEIIWQEPGGYDEFVVRYQFPAGASESAVEDLRRFGWAVSYNGEYPATHTCRAYGRYVVEGHEDLILTVARLVPDHINAPF